MGRTMNEEREFADREWWRSAGPLLPSDVVDRINRVYFELDAERSAYKILADAHEETRKALELARREWSNVGVVAALDAANLLRAPVDEERERLRDRAWTYFTDGSTNDTWSGLRDEMLAYEARQKEQQQGPWKVVNTGDSMFAWSVRSGALKYDFPTAPGAIAVRDALNATWRKEHGHA